MKGEVVTLKTNQRCGDCGRTLTKGSKVRMYRKTDGSLVFYCLGDHQRERGNPATSGEKSEAITLLREMVSLLREIRDCLKSSCDGTETGDTSNEVEGSEENEYPF